MYLKLTGMELKWILFATLVVSSACGLELTEREYYAMPRLFHLDNYETCLAKTTGVYCMGSFDLIGVPTNALFKQMKEFSENIHSFNHTRLHRGYCLSTRCSHIPNTTLESQFEKCVDQHSKAYFNLRARLVSLDYCKTGDKPRTMPLDVVDYGVAGVFGLIVLANIVGTGYHMLSKSEKPNKYLMCWSAIANYRRLVANYDKTGDPKLSALNPVQGVKSITLLLVMLAHTTYSNHLTYLQNPEYLEKASQHPLSAYFLNGSVIVQAFVMISSFLLTYNVLLYLEKNPKTTVSWSMLPQSIVHRVIRLLPVYMMVVGVAATWWRFASDGPLWTPLVEREALRCREKWWTQALFINNFYKSDDPCLVQTWFLAVDMQLYLVAVFLTIIFCKWPNKALKILAGLFFASIIGNFVLSYSWGLKPILYLMLPENMRNQFSGDTSFKYLYTAPWNSLPSSILGVYMAFLYQHLQQSGFKPESSKLMMFLYDIALPVMWLWVLWGCVMEKLTHPLVVSVYAAIDRPVYVVAAASALLGFFYKMDGWWLRLTSWHGFQVLGRMSLCVLMVHWCYNVTLVAQRSQPTYTSAFDIAGGWLCTVVMSYLTSFPLYIMVEAPVQKFLHAVIMGKP